MAAVLHLSRLVLTRVHCFVCPMLIMMAICNTWGVLYHRGATVLSPVILIIMSLNFLSPILSLLLPTSCVNTFLVKHDFLNRNCLSLLLSRCLSLGVILGSAIVKLPQIVKIVAGRSTRGLSGDMYVLENVGYLIMTLYNVRMAYAFSTWGENAFLLAQGFVIMLLFAFFTPSTRGRMMSCAVVLGAIAYYMLFLATASSLSIAQASTIPLMAASRVPQIMSNFQSKSTGMLSAITVMMNVAGTGARVFTTWKEVPDRVVLLGVVSSFAMNTIIAAQMAWYWNNKEGLSQADTMTNKKSSKATVAAGPSSSSHVESEGLTRRKVDSTTNIQDSTNADVAATPVTRRGSSKKKRRSQKAD